VVEMDADLSHDPADVPKLLQALADGADIAVGSRYLNGVRVLNWPQSRLWVSSFGGWYARRLTGLPMTDPTSGFKAIRRRVLEGLDWDKFTAQGYGFQIEIHFLAWQGGFRIQEVPIVFTERREGQSKMSLQIAQEAALRVLQLALRRIFRRARSPRKSGRGIGLLKSPTGSPLWPPGWFPKSPMRGPCSRTSAFWTPASSSRRRSTWEFHTRPVTRSGRLDPGSSNFCPWATTLGK